MTDEPNRRKDRIYIVAIVVWALAIATGMGILWRYKSTPGDSGAAPERWPSTSPLAVGEEPTLIMFIHPQCPCTRASLEELAVLMTQFHGQVRAYVLVERPEEYEGEIRESAYWRRASELAGVNVIADDGGVEKARFGARTSGHTMLFDRHGALLFSGGITASRGHVGDNIGRQRVTALLSQGAADRSDSPVFGCELVNTRK